VVYNFCMGTFSEWLGDELEKRDWTQADLARKSGLTTAGVSHIIKGTRKAGIKSCAKIAKAFDLSPDEVLRAADLLDQLPKDDKTVKDIVYTVNQMSEKLKEDVLEYARFKLQQGKK
jgi:transcriptional regulator with XRE-family HTH domain